MRNIAITLTTLLLLTTNAHALNEMTLVGQYVGENYDDYFGAATAMGDFDDDDYEEFIIGASGWNDNAGKNYYYDSVGDWPTTYLWTVQGDSQNYNYDTSDQNIGDINNDGIEDFGLNEFRAGQDYGRVDIFFGATDFDSLPDFSITLDPGNWIGRQMDRCGDANGDGGNDIILMIWPEGTYDLTTQIYYGGEVLDTVPDWQYTPIFDYNHVCGLGDVNGDGFNDVMILDDWNYNPPLLFFGGVDMDTIPDLIFSSFLSGNEKAAIGDVNADGYNDISLKNTSEFGRAVFFGGPDIDDTVDVFLLDEFGQPTWGYYFVTHGDVNGDGISDLITGDARWGERGVYIYLGSPWFNPVPDAVIISGISSFWNWGEEISVGDVNGDGRDEILISSSDYWDLGLVQLYTGPEEWIDYGAAVEPSDLVYSPGRYKLYQNYPNPFNSSTTIRFELGKIAEVCLSVYDLRGRLIRQILTPQLLMPGGYNVSWSGRNEEHQPVASGVYILELQVDEYKDIKKMVMIR